MSGKIGVLQKVREFLVGETEERAKEIKKRQLFNFVFPDSALESWIPPGVNFKIAEQAYGRLLTLASNISRQMEAISSCKLVFYKKNADGTRTPDPEHPLARMFEEVNPVLTSQDLWQYVQMFKLLTGNAYLAFIEGEIFVLRSSRVEIVPGKNMLVAAYRYHLENKPQEILEFIPEQILHIRRPSPINDWYGLSPLVSGQSELALQHYGMQFNLAVFKNEGLVGGRLEYQGTLNEETLPRVREKVSQMYTGQKNWRRIMVTDNSFKWVKEGDTLKDMEFNVLMGYLDEQIDRLLGVPPILSAARDAGSYALAKEQMRSWWINTMRPQQTQYIALLNQIVNPRFVDARKYEWDWDISGVDALQLSKQESTAIAATGWNADFMTLNEVRAEHDLPPDKENGEMYKFQFRPGFSLDSIFGQTGKEGEQKSAQNVFIIQPKPGENVLDLAGLLAENPAKTIKLPDRASRLPSHEANPGQTGITNGHREPADPGREKELVVSNEDKWRAIDRRITKLEGMVANVFLEFFGEQKDRLIAKLDGFFAPVKAKGRHVRQDIPEELLQVIFDAAAEDKALGEATQKAIKEVVESAGETLAAIIEAQTDVSFDFDGTQPAVVQFYEFKKLQLAEINDTTAQAIQKIILQAIEDGKTVDQLKSQLLDYYGDILTKSRAATIARTETAGAYNFGRFASMSQSNLVDKKRWLTSHDDKVRDSHKTEESRDPIPMDQPFSIGVMYPGDPGGAPEEVINCRCSLIPIYKKAEDV
ncbi:MAG: phage portal protein [candidate division Zixibacteria bacterium]|nr:phage portal protein [candidate division Zixibacteria bacterium]